jgi:hypothetical protein
MITRELQDEFPSVTADNEQQHLTHVIVAPE